MRAVGLLGFDVFGTVVDWRSGVARAAAPFLDRHRTGIEPAAFADAWRAKYLPSMAPVRAGTRAWVKLRVLNRESLDTLLAEHGIAAAEVSPDEMAVLEGAWDRLDPWPDAVAGLTRLKRRYPIVTISNGDIAGMLALARFGGLPWDAILGAEVARAYKPMPEAYLRSAEAAGFTAAETALVAAHNGDLAAARACGLATYFVNRPDEKGPNTGDRAAPGDWDVVAQDLNDLADRLDC
ncbi:MAG TPA: haloacid dehalogenase type II [Sphingomonas sp.]|nr:haloacid dehalogenase type II [Sphingomonas sp.]